MMRKLNAKTKKNENDKIMEDFACKVAKQGGKDEITGQAEECVRRQDNSKQL